MLNKLYLFSLLTLMSGTALLAQPLNRPTYSMMIELGEELIMKKDYYQALDQYKKAYDESRDKSLIPILADLNFKVRDYKKAENYYKRVCRKVRGKYTEVDPQIRLNYGRVLKSNEKYDLAIEQFNLVLNSEASEQLKELTEYQLSGAEMAKVMRPVARLRVENAGKTVNTGFSEYSAVLSGEKGKYLYFGGFNRKDVIIIDEEASDYHAKIYIANKAEEGDAWQEPVALSDVINRPGFHTSNVSLSEDGRTMFFTRQQLEGNTVGESKIYFSTGSDTNWGAANEVVGVNGDFLAKHPAQGEHFGKEVLFFSSNMDGGEGGFDLYYATRKGDGVYADPVNLGPKINTPGDEITPFYREGTLYFSSKGLPGIGGYDIFFSTWDGTRWSKPKNLGVGYNSSMDDKYFMLDQEGFNGTIISNRKGMPRSTHSKTCCDDIWEFTIEQIELDALVGTYNAESGNKLKGATVQLIELTGDVLGETDKQTQKETHIFEFPLLQDKAYTLITTMEGFYPDTSAEFTTVGLTESKKIEKVVKLRPLPPVPEYEEIEVSINEPIRLNKIYYDFDDDKILPDAEQDLNLILDLMGQYSDMKIELSSHTDARGNDEYNRGLSQRRADSARKWLLEKGVSEDRITAVGYGETQILNECTNGVTCSDEEHRFNRRTEFKITEGPTTITIKKKEKRLKENATKTVKPSSKTKSKSKSRSKRRKKTRRN